MGHQQRQLGMVQRALREAAKHPFAKTGVAITAHDEQPALGLRYGKQSGGHIVGAGRERLDIRRDAGPAEIAEKPRRLVALTRFLPRSTGW